MSATPHADGERCLGERQGFLYTGYLRKRNTKQSSILMRNWDKRWFALDDRAFIYANSHKEKVPRQAFRVDEILGLELLENLPGKSHFDFEISLPGRTLRLRPKSETQRRHWVAAVNRARSLCPSRLATRDDGQNKSTAYGSLRHKSSFQSAQVYKASGLAEFREECQRRNDGPTARTARWPPKSFEEELGLTGTRDLRPLTGGQELDPFRAASRERRPKSQRSAITTAHAPAEATHGQLELALKGLGALTQSRSQQAVSTVTTERGGCTQSKSQQGVSSMDAVQVQGHLGLALRELGALTRDRELRTPPSVAPPLITEASPTNIESRVTTVDVPTTIATDETNVDVLSNETERTRRDEERNSSDEGSDWDSPTKVESMRTSVDVLSNATETTRRENERKGSDDWSNWDSEDDDSVNGQTDVDFYRRYRRRVVR